MDISKVTKSVDEGVEVEFILPDGTDTGIRCIVVGRDSEICKAELRKISNKSSRGKKYSQDAAEQDNITTLAACILCWWDKDDPELTNSKKIVYNGEILDSTMENKKMMLKEWPPFSRTIDEAVVNDALFFKMP